MVVKVNESDPRVKRTRQLIQHALMDLMVEKSFQAISVQDIAERATINRATFYAHYTDKFALMDDLIRAQFRQTLQDRLSNAAPLTEGNLHALSVAVFDFFAQLYGHCKPADTQFDPMVETIVHQELYAVLVAWLKQNQYPMLRRRVPVDTTAIAISWAIVGAAVHWAHGDRTEPREEMARHVMAVMIDGVGHAIISDIHKN